MYVVKTDWLVAARFRRRSVRRREPWVMLCKLMEGFGRSCFLQSSTSRLHSSDNSWRPSVTTYTSGPANIADRLLTYRQPTHSSIKQWLMHQGQRKSANCEIASFLYSPGGNIGLTNGLATICNCMFWLMVWIPKSISFCFVSSRDPT